MNIVKFTAGVILTCLLTAGCATHSGPVEAVQPIQTVYMDDVGIHAKKIVEYTGHGGYTYVGESGRMDFTLRADFNEGQAKLNGWSTDEDRRHRLDVRAISINNRNLEHGYLTLIDRTKGGSGISDSRFGEDGVDLGKGAPGGQYLIGGHGNPLRVDHIGLINDDGNIDIDINTTEFRASEITLMRGRSRL